MNLIFGSLFIDVVLNGRIDEDDGKPEALEPVEAETGSAALPFHAEFCGAKPAASGPRYSALVARTYGSKGDAASGITAPFGAEGR